MRFSRVSLSAVALVSSVLLTLSACGSESSSSTSKKSGPAPTVRIALSSWVGFAPLYVAKDQGMFTDHGVNVELIPIEDPADRFNALKADQVEAVATTVDTFAHAIASGAPAKIVWSPDTANGGEGILASSDIKTVADLKGKTIAVNEGSTMEFLLAYVLGEAGLSMDDVTVKNMTSDQAGAAFAAGKVAAAATWEPWLTTALSKNKDGHLLLNTKGDEYAKVMADGIGFSNKVIDSNPATVQKFLEALVDAYAFMESDQETTQKIIADVNKITAKEVAPLMDSTRMLSLEDNQGLMGTEAAPGTLYEVFEAATKFWQSNGKITSPVDAADAIAPEFVRDLG
jgi:NitT/TauT family transport system substrate-binding protein